MEHIVSEKFYNGHKDYKISIIEEGDMYQTTIYEVQPEREVAVFRARCSKEEKTVEILLEEAKRTTAIFPYLIPPL